MQLFIALLFEEFQLWIIFQQNGAPSQWVSLVDDFLEITFPDRLIERDRSASWPLCSSDITPLDFFLWGYVKDRVFVTPFSDIEELMTEILAATAL